MGWFTSLFIKKKPKVAQWTIRKIRIQRIECVNCNKPFQDYETAWVSPSGHLVQHVDCLYKTIVPDEYCDEHGLLKQQ